MIVLKEITPKTIAYVVGQAQASYIGKDSKGQQQLLYFYIHTSIYICKLAS